MRTIGLIGGMSWESTALYYQWINQGIKQRLGGLHSAKLVLVSVEFSEIHALQHRGDWRGTAEILGAAAQRLQKAEAECVMICTNTMHKVADEVEAACGLPLLHIADATARQITADGFDKIGLLGTGFTMSQDFYKGRLTDRFNLDVLIPSSSDQRIVHDIIYGELCLGKVVEDSRREYLRIMDTLVAQGAQAIILGCTEITMLVNDSHTAIPLLDTTAIHARAAVDFALG